MNIGELITAWQSDKTWVGNSTNVFLKKDVGIYPNPICYGEVILFFSILENTFIVDGQPLPYYNMFRFQTYSLSNPQPERDGDAKRLKAELEKFMHNSIQEREEQIKYLESIGKNVLTTNPLLWK